MTNGDLTKGSNAQKGKKNYRKGKLTLKRLDAKISRLAKVNAPEAKFFGAANTTLPSDAIGWTGNVYNLLQPVEGTGEDERIGTTVNIKSIAIRGELLCNDAIQSSTVRMVIIRDWNNGGNVAGSDYFEGVGNALSPYQPYNKNNKGRFTTLFTKMFTLNNSGANTLPFKVYLNKLKKPKVEFQGPLSTDGGVGRIFLIFISGQQTLTPSVTFVSRISYTDI